MNRYVKLVNFEFNRVLKIFAVLLAITLISQIIGVIVRAKSYVNEANRAIYQDKIPKADFILQHGYMSFKQVITSVWFLGPIALCIAAVAFYIFLIWYRDWFGKNTFIYRLLMLPTARLNVFLAKITTILTMTLGFVAFQLIIFPLEVTILKWMVPKEFRIDMGISQLVGSLRELQILFPLSFFEFVLYYGAGLIVVSILFTVILFERSYRLKGIGMGIVYCLVALAVFLSPVLILDFLSIDCFYPIERLAFKIVAGLIVLIGSIWTSKFLLTKKITV